VLWVPPEIPSERLVVRHPRPGDRFRPAGGVGGKKLARWLIDRKIPAVDRPRLVVVADGAEILLICGLARSDRTSAEPVPGWWNLSWW